MTEPRYWPCCGEAVGRGHLASCPTKPITVHGNGWEREWGLVQKWANAPREPRLGCSTISHERLGFCSYCTPSIHGGEVKGVDLELMSWRLLALRPDEEGAPR